jgi:uncharacterized Zn-finger protein
MPAYNTNYYRRNKEKRFKVHTCAHCNFETTGPKSSLQAHIWAKHTEEKNRPFQCPCNKCYRGYSQKLNLHKHMKTCHGIIIPKDKEVFAYVVHNENNANMPLVELTKKQKDRLQFYKEHKIISKDMKNYADIISQEALYYDLKERLISLQPYTKQDIIDLRK